MAQTQCIDCCQTNHMTGIQNLVSYVQGCDCGNGAPCDQQCASEYCLNGGFQMQGDACSTCIDNSMGMGGQCLTPVSSQCQADQDCNAYLTCANACP
jgi:hypothetical protein